MEGCPIPIGGIVPGIIGFIIGLINPAKKNA